MVALDLHTELQRYGAPASGIIPLDVTPTPAQIPYLDLCRSRQRKRERLADAVVELNARPVLYVMRGVPEEAELARICRLLSLRGQADRLALLEPGQMHIIPLARSEEGASAREIVDAQLAEASVTIPRLGLALGSGDHIGRQLHEDLLELLTRTIDEVTVAAKIESRAALSWVSRAMFFRFLIDRRIVKPRHLEEICGADRLEHCFIDAEAAQASSQWMKQVFNDPLPLPRGSSSLRKRQWAQLCQALTNILHRTDASGQLRFDWHALDFGHLPVGLLSQVYESFSHRFERDRAQRDSIHYTPRSLAEYIVAEVIHDLPDAASARILDPASGAGVFLVAGYRALVRAHWQQHGERPKRRALRKILYTQLTGFDVNEVALRLSALSLYLTALELDPSPQPISALRFEDLRGTVLHDMSCPPPTSKREREALEDAQLPPLGSLGEHVEGEHRGRYDLVIGNPPWTAWKRPRSDTRAREVFEARVTEVEAVVQEIVERRVPDARYRMTDLLPDLPFCWRALEWLRPGGRLAFALHARLLFKQARPGLEARQQLFEAMRVTGLLNATALRKTQVWPDVNAPFFVLFGQNQAPEPDDTFTFVSPHLEDELNRRGVMRVDASDAKLIHHAELDEHPALLKTLFRGTELDLAVIDKLRRRNYPTLADYWDSLGLESGQGWQLGGDARAPQSAAHLLGLPELSKKHAPRDSHRVDVKALPSFAHEQLLYPRARAIYRAPLVLLPESPPRPGSGQPAVYFSAKDLAYNRSFFGFSAAGYESSARAKALASYLLLVLASDLVAYISLMRSSRFGVERDTYLLEDVRQLWLRPFEDLDAQELERVRVLSRALLRGRSASAVREDVNEFVFRCHGLGRADMEVVRDTLTVAAPFTRSTREAQRPPSAAEVGVFIEHLRRRLSPFFQRMGVDLDVRRADAFEAEGSPWLFVSVGAAGARPAIELGALMTEVTELADAHGASLVSYRDLPSRTLLVGILRQYRHWTPTRARLLATLLRRVHEDFLVEASP